MLSIVSRTLEADLVIKFQVLKRVPSSLSTWHRLLRFRGIDAPYRLVVALLTAIALLVEANRDSSNPFLSRRHEGRREARKTL